MTDITLTFFKKQGNEDCDAFAGTHAGPSDHPGEWPLIQRNEAIKKSSINVLMIEFIEAKMLSKGYDTKVTRFPYIDVRYKDDITRSVGYPAGMPLSAQAIVSWALGYVNNPSSIGAGVSEPATVNQEGANTSEKDGEEIKDSSETTDDQSGRRGWVIPVAIVGSVAAVAAVATATVLLRNTGSEEDASPLFMTNTDDEEIQSFTDIAWEETRGKKTQSTDSNVDVDQLL